MPALADDGDFKPAVTLCGAKSCVDVAEFVEGREYELKEMVELKHGCPSHDTFSRVSGGVSR